MAERNDSADSAPAVTEEEFLAPAERWRGWRYWQLSGRRRLRAVAQKQVEWPPEQPLKAMCLGGGHPAPSISCNCGIYGARDLDSLRNHGLCVAPGPLVVGEVDLWGRTIVEDYCRRGEWASPASLALVDGTARDDLEQDQVLDALATYGVPVTTMALHDAVAGVTAATLAFQVMSSRASNTRAP